MNFKTRDKFSYRSCRRSNFNRFMFAVNVNDNIKLQRTHENIIESTASVAASLQSKIGIL
jgi:hypothetical protein